MTLRDVWYAFLHVICALLIVAGLFVIAAGYRSYNKTTNQEVTVYVDKTRGVEYLITPNGGITPRLSAGCITKE